MRASHSSSDRRRTSSLVGFLCCVTNYFKQQLKTTHLYYVGLWGSGIQEGFSAQGHPRLPKTCPLGCVLFWNQVLFQGHVEPLSIIFQEFRSLQLWRWRSLFSWQLSAELQVLLVPASWLPHLPADCFKAIRASLVPVCQAEPYGAGPGATILTIHCLCFSLLESRHTCTQAGK